MPKRRNSRTVPVDHALFHPSLIAPRMADPDDDLGDPVAAYEAAVRRQEGFGRHGFRSLIEDLE